MYAFEDLKKKSFESLQLLEILKATQFRHQPTTEELAELFVKGFKYNPIPDYDTRRLTTEKILAYATTQKTINGESFTLSDLLMAEQFELQNPTDFTKPNFFEEYKFDNETLSVKDLNDLRQKSVAPWRLSYSQAQIIEEVTRVHRLTTFKEYTGRSMTDIELSQDIAIIMSELSPEAFMAFFFYHNKYHSKTSVTFSDDNVSLQPFQKTFLRCNNKHIVLKVSRQLGKSTIVQGLAFWYIIMKSGFNGYFIGPQSQTNINFFNEAYSEGNTKLSPWLTEEFCTIEKKGIAKHIHCRRKIVNERGDVVLSNVESKLKMGFARSNARFVGTSNQGLFFDEFATFEVDPMGLIGPTVDTFRYFGFTIFASTIRAIPVDNPMITLLNRKDVRIIERNILSSKAIGKHSERDLSTFKAKCDSEDKWLTEYLNILPEPSDVMISLTDIIECSGIIDNQIQTHKINSHHIYDTEDSIFKLRDVEKLELLYDIHSYHIGLDFNADDKGTNISVLALCSANDGSDVYKNTDTGEYKTNYKYIQIDAYRIVGTFSVPDAVVITYALMDKYEVDTVYCDSGFSQPFKSIITNDINLWKTPGGRKIFNLSKEGEATYSGFEFISFGKQVRNLTIDQFEFDNTSKDTLLVSLLNSIFTLIKTRKLLFSKYESFRYTPLPEYNLIENDDTGKMEKTTENKKNYKKLFGNTKKFAELIPTFKNNCSRMITNVNKTTKLPIGLSWDELRAQKFFGLNSKEFTFVDELRRMKYDAQKNKYINAREKIEGFLVEDDRTIALILALYPAILTYEPYIMAKMDKYIDKEVLKQNKINESNQGFMEIIALSIADTQSSDDIYEYTSTRSYDDDENNTYESEYGGDNDNLVI